jgi:hypothetical protein
MLLLQGRFEYFRCLPSGRIISHGFAPNGITTPAINDLFETQFRDGTKKPLWYLGLIRDDNYTALAAADTLAAHAGWEEGTEYSEVTRRAWSPGAAAGKAISNSAAVEFTSSTEQTYKGLFVASENTKSGTTGILWSTGLFDVEQSMPVGQVLKVYYTLNGREG